MWQSFNTRRPMRSALLTPMRLLCGIAVLTIFCMLSIALITDHLADVSFSGSPDSQSSRVHLISEVTQALKHAQDCRKAYLTTGNVVYLNEYRDACTDVDASMDRLVKEDAVVNSKLAHAQGLRSFVHQKLSEIGRALRFKHAAPATVSVIQAPAARPAATPLSAEDSDIARIQRLLDALGQEESRDISGQLEQAQARSAFHRNLVIAIATINILFLGGVAFCALQIKKLHSLVTMCAWSKRVQYEGEWIPLEDYMRRRFGVRISHGISQEEFDKWSDAGKAEVPPEKVTESMPVPNTQKAAA
jgi:CHASE3 domain sensor protein